MNHQEYPASQASAHELAHPPVRKKSLVIGFIIAFVLIIGGGGAAAYAAMQGWITLPYNLLAPKPPTIQDIAKAVASISSGELTLSMNYSAQEKQANTITLPPYPTEERTTSTNESSISLDLANSIKSQSSKYFMDAKIGIETTNSFDSGNKKDSQGNITLTYQNSGMSLTFNTDYLFVDQTFFLKLNAFPLPMLDFSTLKSQWIRFPNKGLDMSTLLLGAASDEEASIWESEPVSTTSTSDDVQKTFEQRQKELVLFRNALIEKNAIAIESAERAKGRDGSWIWVLRVKLIPDRLIEAIEATIDNHADPAEHKIFTEDLKKELHRAGVEDWIKTAISSVTSEISVDPKTFIPIHQSFHARFATEDSSKLEAPKEFAIDTTYLLAKVNQTKTIAAPKDPLSFSKAVQRLSGQSDEDMKFQQQGSLIRELQQALTIYRDTHHQYPDTLNQMIGEKEYTDEELKQFTANENLSKFYPQRHVARIPNDLFTGTSFIYAPSADKQDYGLKYMIRFTSSTSAYSKTTYIDGLNTATPTSTSIEAEANKDSDQDGLKDSEEKIYGTNIYLKDTDGDGYTDKQEIDSKHDPLKK